MRQAVNDIAQPEFDQLDDTAPEFDYAQLDGETSEFVLKKVSEIRRLAEQTIANVVLIGRHLIEIKTRLGHGHWLPWLKKEFAWAPRTAQGFIQSYEYVSSNPQTPAYLKHAGA
jgi:hypothetical protein